MITENDGDYVYTDPTDDRGDELLIESATYTVPGHPHTAYLQTPGRNGVNVPAEEVPTVVLAIMRAALLDDEETVASTPRLREVIEILQELVEETSDPEPDRDPHVEAVALAILNTIRQRAGLPEVDSFEGFLPAQADDFRDRARSALESSAPQPTPRYDVVNVTGPAPFAASVALRDTTNGNLAPFFGPDARRQAELTIKRLENEEPVFLMWDPFNLYTVADN